jgi:hypothetical protein
MIAPALQLADPASLYQQGSFIGLWQVLCGHQQRLCEQQSQSLLDPKRPCLREEGLGGQAGCCCCCCCCRLMKVTEFPAVFGSTSVDDLEASKQIQQQEALHRKQVDAAFNFFSPGNADELRHHVCS